MALGYNISSVPRIPIGAQASMGPGEVIAKGNNIDMSQNPIVQEMRAKAQEQATNFINGLASKMSSPAASALSGGKGAAMAAGGSGAGMAAQAALTGGAAPAAAGGAAGGLGAAAAGI